MQTLKKVLLNPSIHKAFDLIVPLALIALEICLNLLAIGTIINSFALFLVVLLPIAIVLLILWWPVLVLFYCLLRFFSLR